MSPTVGEPQPKDSPFTGQDIFVTVGVTGELRGQVYLGLTESAALRLISAMMGGFPVTEIDALGQSALAELSNMVCGNAMTRFAAEGFELDITPPSVVMGKDLKISSSKIQLYTVVLLQKDMEQIDLTVGLSK